MTTQPNEAVGNDANAPVDASPADYFEQMARDEFGIEEQEEEQPAEGEEIPAEGADDEPEIEEEADDLPPIDAPVSWDAEAKAKFAELPRDAPSPREAGRFMLAVQDSPLAVTGLQLIADSHGQCSVAVRVEGSPAGTESSAAPIAALSAACGLASSPEGRDPWPERQLLWDIPGIIAKLTYPPARLAELCAALPGATWKLVAQGPGVALLATRENEEGLNKLAHRVRILDGSLVILRGDPDLKRRVNDTALGSSLPLMRAIKRQFDPSGTLNPGRMIDDPMSQHRPVLHQPAHSNFLLKASLAYIRSPPRGLA